MIEVKACNLGEWEWAHFPRACGAHMRKGLNSDHVWVEAWTMHYSWSVDTSHLILLPHCNNKLLRLFGKVFWKAKHFLKLHTRCWGHFFCWICREIMASSNECKIHTCSAWQLSQMESRIDITLNKSQFVTEEKRKKWIKLVKENSWVNTVCRFSFTHGMKILISKG